MSAAAVAAIAAVALAAGTWLGIRVTETRHQIDRTLDDVLRGHYDTNTD